MAPRSKSVGLEHKADQLFDDPIELFDVYQFETKEKIRLPKEAVLISRMPEFRRLRGIAQLGALGLVKPELRHTRFEHSIGVAMMAYVMAESLRRTTIGESMITARHVICCCVAGLLHDVGHGPFSHAYDELLKVHYHTKPPFTRHEYRSQVLARMMCRRANMTPEETELVCHLIDPSPETFLSTKCPLGLDQVVNNKEHGMDVDKMDYLRRDLDRVSVGNMEIPTFDALLHICRRVRLVGRVLHFDVRDMGVIDSLVGLRHIMYEMCYRSPKSDVADQLLRACMLLLMKKEQAPFITCARLETPAHIKTFIEATDEMVLSAIETSTNPEVQERYRMLQQVKTSRIIVTTDLQPGHHNGHSSERSMESTDAGDFVGPANMGELTHGELTHVAEPGHRDTTPIDGFRMDKTVSRGSSSMREMMRRVGFHYLGVTVDPLKVRLDVTLMINPE